MITITIRIRAAALAEDQMTIVRTRLDPSLDFSVSSVISIRVVISVALVPFVVLSVTFVV